MKRQSSTQKMKHVREGLVTRIQSRSYCRDAVKWAVVSDFFVVSLAIIEVKGLLLREGMRRIRDAENCKTSDWNRRALDSGRKRAISAPVGQLARTDP